MAYTETEHKPAYTIPLDFSAIREALKPLFEPDIPYKITKEWRGNTRFF